MCRTIGCEPRLGPPDHPPFVRPRAYQGAAFDPLGTSWPARVSYKGVVSPLPLALEHRRLPELASASAVPQPVIPPVRSRLAPTQPLGHLPAVPWIEQCRAPPHLVPPLAGWHAAADAARVRRRGSSPVLTPPHPSEETEHRPLVGQPPPAPGQPRPPASLNSGEPRWPPPRGPHCKTSILSEGQSAK
jgi:hypothetical protein